ncbi:MAG: DUF2955 domain-containing protein [Gammaproteobacteria bacterium]
MTAAAPTCDPGIAIAQVRILRMAVGIALALAFSQAANWPASFIAPVLASVLLCLPAPAPTVKSCIAFVAVIVITMLLGLQLVPMLHNQPAAGVLLIILALFWCFYFGARGGSPLLTTFLLLGLSLVPVIGSESIDAAIAIIWGLALNAIAAFLFVWLAFALFPDAQAGPRPAPVKAEPPPLEMARHSALRSLAITVPVLLWLLFSSDSSAYAIVLLKVATMGQQSSLADTRAAARDLLLSTLIGGIAALIIWNVLQIWPTLLMYGLLFLLCGLVMGPKIFAGAGAAPRGSVWSYGLLTMMVILAPAAMDSAGGDAAGARFNDRIVMFALATFYAVAAIYVFDRFWPAERKR